VVLETGIIVAGTGYAGSALARHLVNPKNNAPFTLLDKAHGEMLVDLIMSESGVVAGALVARGGQVEPVRAPVVVLATGNVGGLFPGGDWRSSGDGLAIAHRAGLALTRPVMVELEDGRPELRSSIACKPDGTTAVKGLFVAGSLGSDRPDPEKLARAAIVRSREGAEPFGPYAVHPTIDSPLPEGFAAVKFDRLRVVVDRAVRGELPREKALVELHRLKGEADEFARARVDLELFSLQNACEVALLLLKSA
jgi:hypothetical protein